MPISDSGLSERFFAAQAIIRDAGQLALRFYRNRDSLDVEFKGPQDMVSHADREVEDLIRKRLESEFPHDGFFGEESGLHCPNSAAGVWVVDPIDGTFCFLAGISAWCVSIAYVFGGRIKFGAIYDPNSDELFAARCGRGATLNGEPIHASNASRLDEGAIGVGFSNRVTPRCTLILLQRLLEAGGMYYRNGSGALMMAYAAAGRLLGYYEQHINAWDVLAGIILVREAGGWTNDFLRNNGLRHGNTVIACGPGLVEAVERLTADLYDPCMI